MNILFFGDIVGRPGRRALESILPDLRREFSADVVVANVENLAHGKSLTRTSLDEILRAGVDIGTGGDHLLEKPEAAEMLADPDTRIVRPMNWAPNLPGQGEKTFQVGQKTVAVINLLGEFGMNIQPVESPFRTMQRWLTDPPPAADLSLVDIHAEATSEKVNLGWLLDGRVSLVVGTHTHVPTADAKILPHGTGYITDVGMVGLRDSSLGVDKEQALARFLRGGKSPFDIPEHGVVAVNGVWATVVDRRTTRIERLYREVTI